MRIFHYIWLFFWRLFGNICLHLEALDKQRSGKFARPKLMCGISKRIVNREIDLNGGCTSRPGS